MENKLCPIRMAKGLDPSCLEGKCAWWTTAYNTDRYPESYCAIKIIALKDSEGRIRI